MKLFFKKNAIFFITFAVAFGVMFAAFAVHGMYPFGDKQILVIDAWHQYYPFLLEYHQKLQTGSSLLYNHNIGLGVNFMLLGSYYTNSPINLLSVLFPHGNITEFMLFATVIKIALASTFMAMLLSYLYGRKNVFIMLFGLFYGFSAYFLGYYWCIMWLDSVALLPLIVLGMHKTLRGEGEALYIVSLALAVISNYYIAYMICLFIAFYYLYLTATQYRPESIGGFFSQSFYMLFYSILGVALSAFVLLPTLRGMELASSAKFIFPKSVKFERDFITVLHRMLTGVKPEIVEVTGGLPNIASGTLTLYMLYFYFKNRTVRIGEKIASLAMILFLLLGFTTNILNFVWHGFHYPNGIPFRFAFVFVFFVVTLAYKGFHNLEDHKPREILAFMAFGICYLIYSEGHAVRPYTALVSIVSVIVFGLILFFYGIGKLNRKSFAVWMVTMVILESFASAVYGVGVTGYSSRSGYRLYKDDVAAALKQMRAIDSGIYRTEMAKIYTTNDASVYGYRGASVFSSTLNVNVTKFVRKLGAMGDGPSNRYSLPMSSPILDSLFNIKYFIGRNELANETYTGYTELGKWNFVRLMRNDYALPLGFYVPGSIVAYEDSSSNPFSVQENLYSKMADEPVDCYRSVRPEVSYENATATYDGSTRYSYTLTDSGKMGTVTLTYEFEEAGDYYMYCFVPRAHKDKATFHITQGKGRDPREVQDYDVRRGIVIPTGQVEPGGSMKLEFKLEKGSTGHFDFVLVKGDFKAFQKANEHIRAHSMEITKWKDTKIEGKAVAPDKGYIFMSIPYEKGWTAKVNGSPVLLSHLKHAMILVPVSKGMNRIELSYFPDGLRGGLIISGFALMSLLVVTVFGRRLNIGFYKKHNYRSQVSIEDEVPKASAADFRLDTESLSESSSETESTGFEPTSETSLSPETSPASEADAESPFSSKSALSNPTEPASEAASLNSESEIISEAEAGEATPS